MYEKSWTLIVAPALLVALSLSPSSASTICNASIYGYPNLSDCQILLQLGSLDRKPHFFFTGDWNTEPSDVTSTQWQNKVDLAKKISNSK